MEVHPPGLEESETFIWLKAWIFPYDIQSWISQSASMLLLDEMRKRWVLLDFAFFPFIEKENACIKYSDGNIYSFWMTVTWQLSHLSCNATIQSKNCSYKWHTLYCIFYAAVWNTLYMRIHLVCSHFLCPWFEKLGKSTAVVLKNISARTGVQNASANWRLNSLSGD